MPRRGDESNRLGNEYEELWIADSLLDVIAGDALSVTVAAFGAEGAGIDVIKQTSDGFREFHSLKRQTTSPMWKLRELSERNIIKELLEKLEVGENHKAVFVSGTTSNELNELCERAKRSQELGAFQKHLDESSYLREPFESHFLPHCNQNWITAWKHLQRLRVGGMPSDELKQRIKQKARLLLQPKDSGASPTLEAHILLSNLVLNWLGQAIEKRTILDYLLEHGFVERLYFSDRRILDRIQAIQSDYLSDIEAELIHDNQIERPESHAAIEALVNGQKRIVAIIGAAGLGKSCVLAQTLRLLNKDGIPSIVARLDVQTQARTSQQFGEDLNLPESPCLILAGVARGAPCVLVLDQLDALSTVSGRNAHLWTAFNDLIKETALYPNMRVMLTCRAFDAEHDPRLRRLLSNEERSHCIQLNLLSVEQVRESVTKTGVKSKALDSLQEEILRTPQNLNLYLQTKPNGQAPFRDVKELFDRYWESKQQACLERSGREIRFTEIVRKLSGWLSDHQTLAAPSDILDEFRADAKVMASAHIVVSLHGRWRFFHESFFDYAFARTFVSDEGRLIDLLVSSIHEQHLFRRAQVRQILTYQRDRDFKTYLRDVETILGESRVRFHIKKLLLDWLRLIDKPTLEEWRLLSQFSNVPELAIRIKMVPHNSPGWFDVLNQEGVWDNWLSSRDESEVDHAIRLLSLTALNRHRSEKVADLLADRLDGSTYWRKRFAEVVFMGAAHCSRKMFNLFLRAVREGWFDDARDSWWYFTLQIAEEAPEMAIEFLAVFVERWSSKFDGEATFHIEARYFELPERFIDAVEERVPLLLARNLFPLVTSIVQAYTRIDRNGRVTDKIWGLRSFGSDFGVGATLLESLRRVIQKLAVEAPCELDRISQAVEPLPHETIAFLLLSAWSANPQQYADKIVTYLCAMPDRLDIGYWMWSGGGYGPGHVSRVAVKTAVTLCTDDNYSRLEKAIIQFEEFGERSQRHGRGYKRLWLLHSLPKELRSPEAQSQYEQLLRKFPDEEFAPLQSTGGMRSIVSPIDHHARKKMTDLQWIRAMEKYSGENSHRIGKHWARGGRDELAGALEEDTAVNKSRFAKLVLQMPVELPAIFFSNLLDGLVKTEPVGEIVGGAFEATQLLETEPMVLVLRRIHNLPSRPCGRAICWAVRKLANRPLPDEVLEMIVLYAIEDPNPTEEPWKASSESGAPYRKIDHESAGLNCTRGAAAGTLANLLFADANRWQKLKPAVESVSRDFSLAVRATAVECLTATLNVDRDWAVNEFLRLADGAEEILGGHNTSWFLHYATRTHYGLLRPLMLRMLRSSVEKARNVAARQITVAVVLEIAPLEDLGEVLQGDSICRASAGQAFSDGFEHEAIRDRCREHLKLLFNDAEKSVRETTDGFFRKMDDEQLSKETDLILSFTKSEAFADDASQLCLALKDSIAPLPNVVCIAAERLIQLHKLKHGSEPYVRFRSDGHYISELIVRLYQQTTDAKTKTRCLDIIDEMLRVEVWSAEEKLEKVER